jgi:alkylhydroperoxidase/carboxymuconolactone decarboxylase family protein
MRLEQQSFARLLAAYQDLKLVSEPEVRETLSLFDAAHPLHSTVGGADSLHMHVKVDDTAALPRADILALGATPESEQSGYVKFAHGNGLNMIFSSIDVSVEDLIKEAPQAARPRLDHLGIDLRSLEPPVVALFNKVPEIARSQEWAHVAQGGDGQPVYCCHTEVSGKHWLFPRNGGGTRPIEIASGPLKIHGAKMGCDLRPIDPAHPFADKAPSCCAPQENASPSHYYDPKDLGRFAEMGKYASPLMAKFFDYYLAVTATEGALTKREKALIGLAVAHSKQCPYCIEAYTSQCVATGSTPDAMHEAVHVAAALSAGIDLVHGVQMQNSLRAKHVIS